VWRGGEKTRTSLDRLYADESTSVSVFSDAIVTVGLIASALFR
jgi:hypothetical protein